MNGFVSIWPPRIAAAGAFVSAVLVSLVLTTGAAAAPMSWNDSGGANDQPGQKDLTHYTLNYANLPASVEVGWSWDMARLSGSNTGDACALIDTGADRLANYALCATIAGNPAQLSNTRLYSCGNGRPDRCSTPVDPLASFASTCSASVGDSDPFSAAVRKGPGADYPDDTNVSCDLEMSDFTVGIPNLVNVCSYPSQQPNSDPSDCILSTNDGFLMLATNVGAADSSSRFDFALDGSPWVSLFGSQMGPVVPVSSNVRHSVTESSAPEWRLDAASCSNGSGVLSGDTLAGIDVAANEFVICTFENSLKPARLHVVTQVINDDHGQAAPGDFIVHVTQGGNDVAGSPQPGSTSGGDFDLPAGTYQVGEAMPTFDYFVTYSGDCDASGKVTLVAAGDATCVIVNNDLIPF